MKHAWKEIAQELYSIAQAGLTYSKDRYDIQRFERLREISAHIMSEFTNTKMEKIADLFAAEEGYLTPKVDIRAAVFQDERLLLVRERDNRLWSLPGGWADVGLSPAENAVREVAEEAGLTVRARKIIALWDKKCHPHPPDPFHVYKIIFLCEIVGGELKPGFETSEAAYFQEDSIPELSANRTTRSQVRFLFDYLRDPGQQAVFD
jgi:ADP-ribose pyrophosphatase YjhB (NUDIX family)